MPGTSSRASSVANGPWVSRCSTSRAAVAGPSPGTWASSTAEAVLTFVVNAGFTGGGASWSTSLSAVASHANAAKSRAAALQATSGCIRAGITAVSPDGSIIVL